MASILNTAAQRVNADTAGRTTDPAESPAGAPSGATVAEAAQRVFTTASGALDSLFRMEPMLPPTASPQAVRATSAVHGPHGGLVPARLKNIVSGAPAPGPGPGPELGWHPTANPGGPDISVGTAAQDTKNAATSLVASIRRILGL